MGWDYEREERDEVARENRAWSDEQSRLHEAAERRNRLMDDLAEEAKRQLEAHVESLYVAPVGDRVLLSVSVDGETYAVSGDPETGELVETMSLILNVAEGGEE